MAAVPSLTAIGSGFALKICGCALDKSHLRDRSCAIYLKQGGLFEQDRSLARKRVTMTNLVYI